MSSSISKAPQRKSGWLYCTIVLLWGAIPPVIMLVLLFLPGWFSKLKGLWSILAILWSFASLVIFYVVLHGGFGRRSSRVLQGLMGLMCTFVLGLPAIIVSSLPLIGSPIDLIESLNPRGNEVVLEEAIPDADEKPVLYLVGLDLSTSFVSSGSDARLEDVYEALDSIFWSMSDEGFSDSLNPKDLILFFGFADEGVFLTGNERDGQGRESLRRRPSEELHSDVSSYLNGKIPPSTEEVRLNRSTTDIVNFLDTKICAQIRDREDGYSKIRVILFSDLIQSVPLGDSGDNLESMKRKRSERLNKIEGCLKRQGISVTAFYLPPHKGSREALASAELDIGGHFTSNLSEKHWREVKLDEYDGAEPDKKIMMCEGLYSRIIPVASPLYLKYRPGPDWQTLSSRIRLPTNVEADKIFLGLASIPNIEMPIKVRLGKERADDFVLGLSERDVSFKSLERTASEQNPLELAIEGYPDTVRDARAQLLVAVPRQSVIYKVPLIVLAILPNDSLIIIKIVLFVLHLFPSVLAWMVVRDVRGARPRVVSRSSALSAGG